jgi:cephalosporin hydroxylase
VADGKAVLAYVVSDSLSYSWHRSMWALRDYDDEHSQHLRKPGGYLAIKYGTGGLIEARNQACQEFRDDYDAEWLFWLDTDMGFSPDALDALLEAADPAERPIVGGLCFAQRDDEPDGYGGWRVTATPTVYDWITLNDQSGYAVRWDYPQNTVTQGAATGSACVLIHRSVLEKMREAFASGQIRPAWYDRLPNPSTKQIFSEDLSFCARAGALGFPVFVHTGVKTTHYKHQWVSEEDYIRQRVVQAVVDKPDGSPLAVHIDVAASLETLERNEHVRSNGMLKLLADLERYEQIIDATNPGLVIETGTRSGASAEWFAKQGCEVITIDVSPVPGGPAGDHQSASKPTIHYVQGDAADPAVVDRVKDLVNRIGAGRVMVSLDSDHSGPHVSEEIKLYGPLVTPGCYLVVEDGIFGYATRTLRTAHGLGEMVGSPLDAIEEHLDGNPDWSRDIAIERLSPVTHHPAGFWLRNA